MKGTMMTTTELNARRMVEDCAHYHARKGIAAGKNPKTIVRMLTELQVPGDVAGRIVFDAVMRSSKRVRVAS